MTPADGAGRLNTMVNGDSVCCAKIASGEQRPAVNHTGLYQDLGKSDTTRHSSGGVNQFI
jgi:hypothetical protein